MLYPKGSRKSDPFFEAPGSPLPFNTWIESFDLSSGFGVGVAVGVTSFVTVGVTTFLVEDRLTKKNPSVPTTIINIVKKITTFLDMAVLYQIKARGQ